MRAACILILAGLIVSAVQGSVETKDELLSLLDEIEPVVSDVNTVTEAALHAAAPVLAEPNEPVSSEAFQPAATADPNQPEVVVEPNSIDMVTAPAGSVTGAAEQRILEQSRQLRREFFRVQLEPVKTMTSVEQEQKLDALIAKVNSLEPVKKLIVVSEEPQTAEPEESAVDVTPEQTVQNAIPVESGSETAGEPNSMSSSLLADLEKAGQVVNPILLADAVYRQGHAHAAYTYYKQAAEQLGSEDAEATQWVLFQMANCLRDSDPVKALKIYSDLLARFPNCRWSAAAQSRKSTLEWIMKESVKELVAGGL